ncbi:hypothetical protein [Aliiruegeria sabulilitoris]|uniref:hypothetical protein n=1 Tax=Aliiruegeria sabulilitoris TaxID=1510458 RepID=UPI00082E1FA0|nr:hypothetical protein [Aliiruegeria sabulilitoris]NDR57348.1 hypothetical protein [Pseudoruegeria sp. M32A2M]
MKRTTVLAGIVAILAMPALASQTQLARTAGVEPGLYSTSQLVQIVSLREEGGNAQAIERILANPEGAPLVSHLSTHGPNMN